MAARSHQNQPAQWLPAIEQKITAGRPPRADRKRPSRSRHSRKCQICCHARRGEIERDFLHWRSPDRIARDYGLADHSTVYRHVHATGLFERRRKSVHVLLDDVLGSCDAVMDVSAQSIVQAVRLSAILDGQWTEPSTHHIVEHRITRAATDKANRQIPELERPQRTENKGALSS